VYGPPLVLAPGDEGILRWTLPDLDGQPIQGIGVALTASSGGADGIVWLDFLRWDGEPNLILRRPTRRDGEMDLADRPLPPQAPQMSCYSAD
jgi:hypothetical protein